MTWVRHTIGSIMLRSQNTRINQTWSEVNTVLPYLSRESWWIILLVLARQPLLTSRELESKITLEFYKLPESQFSFAEKYSQLHQGTMMEKSMFSVMRNKWHTHQWRYIYLCLDSVMFYGKRESGCCCTVVQINLLNLLDGLPSSYSFLMFC